MKSLLTLTFLVILISSCEQKTARFPASDEDFWNITPERDINVVHPSTQSEEVVRLRDAKIVIVDYDLVRRDFPTIQHLPNHEIDEWLLENLAYVSKPQANQHRVNTPIKITDKTREALRPPKYGRALVFDMNDPVSGSSLGLMDVKGSGSLRPSQADHGNGVATLGESIREFLYENLMRRVLKDNGQDFKTVGSYAVIDAGFEVLHADGSTSPAGLYVRQAHVRPYSGSEWLPDPRRTQLQAKLRTYGIDPNENIQGTLDHRGIYDFGHYVVKDDLPLIDIKKQVPFNMWGYDKNIKIPSTVYDSRWFYSKQDHPWFWSHELADSWRKGTANRDDVWNHFVNMLSPVEQKLQTGIGGQGTCRQLLEKIIH